MPGTTRSGSSRKKTTIKQIRADVDGAFHANVGATLTPAAKVELKDIFDHTIGRFAKKHRKDVWRNTNFRGWILLAARRIAIEAGATATKGQVQKKPLRLAAFKVMLKMHGQCPKPPLAGKFRFPKRAKQGEVCQPFLESQLTA